MDGKAQPTFSLATFSLAASSSRNLVLGLLLLSLILRWALIFKGGQEYFPDEQRYQISREVAESLRNGEFKVALTTLFTVPDHLGFKILGTLPALLEWSPGTSQLLPAMFFSVFSVLNIFLIYLISIRSGASVMEAVFALTLATLNTTLFYYSRHVLPYDVSMFLGLCSLHVGLSKDAKATSSLICGALGMLCFITYNGYWPLAGVGIIIRLLSRNKTFAEMIWNGVALSLGFLLPFVFLLALGLYVDSNLYAESLNFAQTVTQGSYREGWSLPFAYFWNTEHLSLIVMGLLSLLTVLNLRSQKYERTTISAFCALYLYLCLLVPSVITSSFVVYGRLARQLMPFLILLSATGLYQLSERGKLGRLVSGTLITLMSLQTLWNLGESYNQSYPRDFASAAQADFKDFRDIPVQFGFRTAQTCESNGYELHNAKYFLTVPASSLTIPGNVLMSASHPVNFPPYQYEGYSPEQRQAFQKANLSMTLVQIEPRLSKEDLKELGIESCLNR